jgi:hypothetical protein
MVLKEKISLVCQECNPDFPVIFHHLPIEDIVYTAGRAGGVTIL